MRLWGSGLRIGIGPRPSNQTIKQSSNQAINQGGAIRQVPPTEQTLQAAVQITASTPTILIQLDRPHSSLPIHTHPISPHPFLLPPLPYPSPPHPTFLPFPTHPTPSHPSYAFPPHPAPSHPILPHPIPSYPFPPILPFPAPRLRRAQIR